MIESIVFATSGLALGVVIDKQFDKLRKRFPKSRIPLILAQLFTLATIIAVLYRVIPGDVVRHFQATLPGMAFPAMFFGVQSSLFTAAQSV
jgi:uncharacterized BrkB/YihY/UPF0761 family membrane protein